MKLKKSPAGKVVHLSLKEWEVGVLYQALHRYGSIESIAMADHIELHISDEAENGSRATATSTLRRILPRVSEFSELTVAS